MTERSLKKPYEPMLATAMKDMASVNYPVMASPKIDGFRLCIRPEGARLRSLEEIENEEAARFFRENYQPLIGFDGEIVSGPPNAKGVLGRTDSVLSSIFGEAKDLRFYVFDDFTNPRAPYIERHKSYFDRIMNNPMPGVIPIRHEWIHNEAQMMRYEERCVDLGFEGAMIRDPNGIYKHGRATVKEGALLKIKRFEDDEGRIIRVYEKMHNENELERDARGHAKRSKSAGGLVGAGTLGGFVLDAPNWPGVEVHVGSGISDDLAAHLWSIREDLPGQLVTFKHMPSGAKDAPRHPVFKSIRNPRDTSTPSPD